MLACLAVALFASAPSALSPALVVAPAVAQTTSTGLEPQASRPADDPVFDAAEIEAIGRLGPWPPPLATDPSNRVSGNPEAASLGRQLFADPRLSPDGAVACTTCHDPAKAFADGRPRSRARVEGRRNAPGLVDVRFNRWFGWDGGDDTLWAMSLRPILDPREIGGSIAGLASLLRSEPPLSTAYARAFGRAPVAVSDATLAVDAAKALAAFQETLVSARTPFDAFRDALVAGDAAAAAKFPAAARRGARLFVGRGNCALCHGGPTLSHGEFADVGVPFFTAEGVDPGRHAGLKALRESPYTLLGPWSDDPARSTAMPTRHVEAQHRNFGEFRVPALRGVAATAPYMHDGSKATLREVVRHYSTLDLDRLHADGETILKPLGLTEGEIDDLVAFLEALSPAP
jgi:cytochrome c peroxidase